MNCKKCDTKLLIGESWTSSMKKAGNYKCKSCHSKKVSQWNKNNSNILKSAHKKHYNKNKHDFVVYLLEEDNYVGVTENLYYRKAVHKHLNRNTDKVRVLYQTKNRADALELEELLHDIGYEGRHSQNTYK